MKKEIKIPLSAAAMGVAGAALKYIQDKLSYDGKGLIRYGDPVTIMIAVLSVAFCVVMFVRCRNLWDDKMSSWSYSEAFPLCKWKLAAIELGAVVILVSSFFVKEGTVMLRDMTVNFTAILGACAGISCGLLALTVFFKRKGIEQELFSAVPAVFFCFLMALVYKDYAGKPVLSRYCYECIAFGSAAVAFYCCAGHAFGRTNGFVNVLSQVCAIYFLIMAIPGYTDKWLMVISAAAAFIIGANLSAYLSEHPEPAEPESSVKSDEN